MVLEGFDNFPIFFLSILIFVTLGDIFWFYSTTFFNMFLKVFASSLLLVTILFPSISVISVFCENPLFVRNRLMKVQEVLFAVMPLFVTLLGKDFMFFLPSDSLSFISCYVFLWQDYCSFYFNLILV